MNPTRNPLFYLSLVLALIVGLQAWSIVGAQTTFQEPTSAFPASDVSAPVEIGGFAQTKRGVLSFAPAGDPADVRVSIGTDGLYFDDGGAPSAPTWNFITTIIGGGIGPEGDPGVDGSPGVDGFPGADGIDGLDCGDNPDYCSDGSPGVDGPTGFIGWRAPGDDGSTPGTDYPGGISYGYTEGGSTGWGREWGTYLSVKRDTSRFFQIDVDAHGASAYLRAYYSGPPEYGWSSWRKFVLENEAGDVNITENLTVGGAGAFPTSLELIEKNSSCSCTPSYPSCDAADVLLGRNFPSCDNAGKVCGIPIISSWERFRVYVYCLHLSD